MHKNVIIFLTLLFTSLGNAQTIQRWTLGKSEITSKTIPTKIRTNIFQDYLWTKPDLGSKEFYFTNGKTLINWKGKSWEIKKNEDSTITVSNNELISITSNLLLSNGDMYYDKSKLKLKPEIKQRWVSYLTYVSQTLPVTRYRNVTSYQYNASTGTSTPVYRMQSYIAYETKQVPQTRWKWENYTVYTLDIPNYNYYSFIFSDSTQLFVYEDSGKYFLQTPSYSLSEDENGISYIITDNNTNGILAEIDDAILFNSWNPYSKFSKYKKVPFFKDNSWYNLKFLFEENFLSTEIIDSHLVMNYRNEKYSDSKEKGKLILTNLPKDAEVKINGKYYKSKKKGKYKSEYGLFKINISRKGYLDFEELYEINEENMIQNIIYKPQGIASIFKLKNLFKDDYFVTISNKDNYHKTYHNLKQVNVPIGDIDVEIYTDGSVLTKKMNSKKSEIIEFDYESEIQKVAVKGEDKESEIEKK